MKVRFDLVSHIYDRSDEVAPVRVLQDVTLEIASGDFAVLRGASGSGKSTILSLMGAIERPSAGRIILGSDEITSLPEAQLTLIRRKRIGFVFQAFHLIPTLDVEENVAFPLALARLDRRTIRERVSAVLEEVGLAERRRHMPNELSGGEMQRVAVARAVVHEPELLLADEPTGNLDSKNGAAVLELIRDIHRRRRATIVMATHSDATAAWGDYTLQVEDGLVQPPLP